MFLRLQRYERPTDLVEAMTSLARPGAKALAGGTAAVGPADGETTVLVDLAGLGLRYIRTEPEAVVLGALTTLDDLTRSPEVLLAGGGVLAQAADHTGPPTLLARATVGGALARPDRAGELVAALLALDARVTLVRLDSAGTEVVRQEWELDTCLNWRITAMAGSLVEAVRIPTAFMLTAMERVARTPRDVPTVAVAASVHVVDDRFAQVRLAATGVAPLPARLTEAEATLLGAPATEAAIARAAEAAAAAAVPPSDLRGAADYRRHLAGVLTGRALTQALWPLGRM